ncbi:MAG: hypothetical protein JO140_00120 [Candidatus Eremiobacteraeota bacterium]|nr:hypothetical protein [Candidatus Eremiobacteraeota bacterium]
MTFRDDNTMIPCECFTVLETRSSDALARCDVCDHDEAAHERPGRRRFSGAQIEEERRRMLTENFEKFSRDRGT